MAFDNYLHWTPSSNQQRRAIAAQSGSTADNDAYIGVEGQITYDNERKGLRVHDGETEGGRNVSQPEFARSYKTADENGLTLTSLTTVDWDAADHINVNGVWSASNPSRLTPPASWEHVELRAHFWYHDAFSATSATQGARFLMNGSEFRGNAHVIHSREGSTFGGINIVSDILTVANRGTDYFEAQIFVENSASEVDIQANRSYFTIRKIG